MLRTTSQLFLLMYQVHVAAAVRHVAGCVEGRLPSTRCARRSICIALAKIVGAARASCCLSMPVLCLILPECSGRLSCLLKEESMDQTQRQLAVSGHGTAVALPSHHIRGSSHLAVKGRHVAVVSKARWAQWPLSGVLLC